MGMPNKKKKTSKIPRNHSNRKIPTSRDVSFKKGMDAIATTDPVVATLVSSLARGIHPSRVDLPGGARPQQENARRAKSDKRNWWTIKLDRKFRLVFTVTPTDVVVHLRVPSDSTSRTRCKRS